MESQGEKPYSLGLEEISQEEEREPNGLRSTLGRKDYQKIVSSLAGGKPEEPEWEPRPEPEHTFKRKMDPGQVLQRGWGELAEQEVTLTLCNLQLCSLPTFSG